jgi:hypothetical protein
MRKRLIDVFEDSLNNFLKAALGAILGPNVRDEVYTVLSARGITSKDVPARFDDVVKVLTETFGALGSKVILHKAIVDLYLEYSQRIDFSFGESLQDKLLFLRERVVSEHIWPRRYQNADSFFDKEERREDENPVASSNQASWNGLYHYKKGVGSDSNPSW